jgi:hypothetical protein
MIPITASFNHAEPDLTYWIQCQKPVRPGNIHVDHDLFMLEPEFLEDNMDTMRPSAAMVRIKCYLCLVGSSTIAVATDLN